MHNASLFLQKPVYGYFIDIKLSGSSNIPTSSVGSAASR